MILGCWHKPGQLLSIFTECLHLCVCGTRVRVCVCVRDDVRLALICSCWNSDCLQLCGGGIPILSRGPHSLTSVSRGFSLPLSVCVNECVDVSMCVHTCSLPLLLLLFLFFSSSFRNSYLFGFASLLLDKGISSCVFQPVFPAALLLVVMIINIG